MEDISLPGDRGLFIPKNKPDFKFVIFLKNFEYYLSDYLYIKKYFQK
jgi:hypothetical protein